MPNAWRWEKGCFSVEQPVVRRRAWLRARLGAVRKGAKSDARSKSEPIT